MWLYFIWFSEFGSRSGRVDLIRLCRLISALSLETYYTCPLTLPSAFGPQVSVTNLLL